jgi:hypothetical protein
MRLLRWMPRPRRHRAQEAAERELRARQAIDQALLQVRHQQDQDFARDLERRRLLKS